jgi:hypothetical protein
MWVLLSSRLRTWLLMAIALPLIRMLVHRIAERAQRRAPQSSTAKLAGRADAALTSLTRRAGRRSRARRS